MSAQGAAGRARRLLLLEPEAEEESANGQGGAEEDGALHKGRRDQGELPQPAPHIRLEPAGGGGGGRLVWGLLGYSSVAASERLGTGLSMCAGTILERFFSQLVSLRRNLLPRMMAATLVFCKFLRHPAT